MNAVYPRTSNMAVISLIFGILSYVFIPFIGALIAVICGHAARAEIRRAPPGTIDGDGMALAGLILGWIQIALCIIGVVVVVLFIMGAITAASAIH